MKNLFKNLMLVAVAAMAFTACSQDVNEVNKVEKVTRYEFTANIADDTRSGFAEKEEGATAYKSEWYGNETLKVFVTDYSAYNVETTTTVDEEGNFTLELTDAPDSFFVTVVSPAESWASEYTANIPAVQTPLANSVDPKAHLLQAQAKPVSDGVADIDMNHMAAYGKMTVNGVAFAIDHVVVDLKGSYYSYDREYSYTINATNVENNTFWFATEPIDVAEFTVTAYDAEGKAVTKTVDVAAAGKTMSFQYGRVGTFSVSGLEEAKEVYDYTTAYVSKTWGDTDKLITFTAEGKDILNVNFAGRSFDGNAIAAGTYYYGDGVYSYGISFGDYSGSVVSVNSLGSVVVSVVDGCYLMEFNGLKLPDGSVIERITFKGTIEGLDVPDSRTRLATPEVTYELNGKTLTVSWSPVDGAVGYYVHDYYYDIDTTTTDTTLTVELTEYKWYYIYVSAVAAADDANFKNSAEAEVSFELKDPRTVLSNPTNVTVTTDGANATLSWDAVEGADYYQVSYYWNGNNEVNVEGTSCTLELGYSQSVWVYIRSKANDDNPNYRSSESWNCEVQVNTGKDPNVFADYLFDTLAWNSQYSRFELSGNGNGVTQFYVNSSDSPNNNSIKVRTYTYAGNTVSNPGVGTFSLRYLLGSGAGSSHYVYDATMSVAFENDQYVILITINDAGNSNVVGKTFGYKGMPEGWLAPAAGGEEPDQPDQPDQPGEGGTQSYEVTAGSTDWNWLQMTFTAGSKTLTGRLKYPKASQASGEYTLVAGSSSTNYTFHSIAVDGVAATSVSGTISLQINVNNGQFFDITFNDIVVDGMTFTGFAKVSLP